MTEPSAPRVPFIPSTPQIQTTGPTPDFLGPWEKCSLVNWPAAVSQLSPEKPGFHVSVTCRGDGGKQEICQGLSTVLDESYASSAKVKVKNE